MWLDDILKAEKYVVSKYGYNYINKLGIKDMKHMSNINKRSSVYTNKVVVHKNDKKLIIYKKELQSYLDKGWIRGSGNKWPEECKEKLSKTQKKRMTDIKLRKKISESVKNYYAKLKNIK